MPTHKPARIECPVARALECVGEWWSILILRDAFQGLTRFDGFQRSLGIAPNILTRRLAHLTKEGLFERRLYNARPPRYEYVLTPKGRDFFGVIMAIFAWGNRHLAPAGEAILLAERDTLRSIDPLVVDAHGLSPLTTDNVVLVPGPRASVGMRKRLASMRTLRADTPLQQE